jgi:hypothetical protein
MDNLLHVNWSTMLCRRCPLVALGLGTVGEVKDLKDQRGWIYQGLISSEHCMIQWNSHSFYLSLAFHGFNLVILCVWGHKQSGRYNCHLCRFKLLGIHGIPRPIKGWCLLAVLNKDITPTFSLFLKLRGFC